VDEEAQMPLGIVFYIIKLEGIFPPRNWKLGFENDLNGRIFFSWDSSCTTAMFALLQQKKKLS
jgi:hypothetical protein